MVKEYMPICVQEAIASPSAQSILTYRAIDISVIRPRKEMLKVPIPSEDVCSI